MCVLIMSHVCADYERHVCADYAKLCVLIMFFVCADYVLNVSDTRHTFGTHNISPCKFMNLHQLCVLIMCPTCFLCVLIMFLCVLIMSNVCADHAN